MDRNREPRPPAEFRPFGAAELDACLALFDANCPASFAPNERAEYRAFLAAEPVGYELALLAGRVVGAFGLTQDDLEREPRAARLSWILIDPAAQGRGLGCAMLERVTRLAKDAGLERVLIAASQHSAPFFERFGAREVGRAEDGWGPGMHRVDMVLDVASSGSGAGSGSG